MSNMTTYLSPNVRELLSSVSSTNDHQKIKQNDLSIDRIRQCLTVNSNHTGENEIDYLKSVRELDREILLKIEYLFNKMTIDEFQSLYNNENYCNWLQNHKVNI